MAEKSFFQRALEDPYLLQVPSQRPEVVTAPGARMGPAPEAPLRSAVVKKLRTEYPDLDDLGDDELLKGVHGTLVEDKVLMPESTPDDLLRHLGRSGVILEQGKMGRTGPRVSTKQMNVPVLPEGPPSESLWPSLIQKHWPELADLDAKTVLRGVFKEQRKSGKLPSDSTFEQFLTGLVGSGTAVAKGVPGKTLRGLAAGVVEPFFVAPVEAAASLLAAGGQETPEAEGLRARGIAAAGRAAGAFITAPMAAAEALGGEALVKAGVSAKELIAHQIASNAKALGIFNALTTTGEVAPEVAAGDMSLGNALARIGLSTALGAATGAVVGPVVGALAHPARITARNEAAAAIARTQVEEAKKKAIDTFIKDFRPEWLRTRFPEDLDLPGTDENIARSILTKVLNVKPEEVPADMLSAMVNKIAQYKDSVGKDAVGLGAKVYPEVALPQGTERIGQPIGAPLEITPGVAPEPRAMEPSPLTEPPRAFTPPTAVEPTPGLETPVPSAAAPEPIVPEVRPTIPSVPPAEVPPAAAALPREGGMGPEPRQVLPQAPAFGEVKTPFTPPKTRRVTGLEGPGTPERQSPARGVIRTLETKPEILKLNESPTGGITISHLAGAGEEGGSSQILQRVVAEADLASVPVELIARSTPVKKGGKVPLDKLVEWYKAHGFQVVEEAGDTVSLRRSPVVKNPVADPVVKALAEEGPAIGERVQGVEAANAVEAAGNVVSGKPMIRPGPISEGAGWLQANPGDSEPTKQLKSVIQQLLDRGEDQKAFDLARKSGLVEQTRGVMRPTLGARVEKQLDLFASAAEERLKGKLGRLQAGFDPSMLVDLSIIGAAKMYKLGMRSQKAFNETMTKLYGEVIRPHLKDLYQKSLKILERSILGGPTKKQVTHLLELAKSGRHGMKWYDETAAWAKKTFGEDADMMLRFLAATSADSATEAGATMAMKAYAQWKLGLPFSGFRSKSMAGNLERAARGEQFGGDKIDSFYRALRGDEDAVVLDRWMMKALGFKNPPTAFGSAQYRMFSEVVRDMAAQEGMTTRQFQAAIWEGARVQSAHQRFAQGGAKAVAQIGSARPLEQLVNARLGGKSPLQWVESNNLTTRKLSSASAGMKAAREQGGYSFNPFTWEADKTPGYIVTLASDVVPKNLFYTPMLMEFRKRFAQHIEGAGADMFRRGQHLNVGVWDMGQNKPDHFSMDLNIVLPEYMKEQALKLGLENKQFEVGHIDAQGNYTGFKTGYEPTVHGKQDVPTPAKQSQGGQHTHGPKRLAWFEKANTKVSDLLDKLGPMESRVTPVPSEAAVLPDEALSHMVQNPATALAKAGEILGKTPEEMKKLIDEGQFKPMSDAGMEGRLFVNRDGTVWEYVDPKGPSYNTTRLFGMLRGGKLAEVLQRMEGREVVRGQEFLDNYRGQAGYIGGARPAEVRKVIAQSKNNAKAVKKLIKAGAEPVPVLGSLKYAGGKTQFEGMSLWLTPDGRVLDAGYHAKNAARAGLKNPISYEGSESDAIQSALNNGIARIQLHRDLLAMDSTTPITAAQVNALKTIRGSRQFGGRVVNPNGTHESYTEDFNEFVTQSRENIMRLLREKPVAKPKVPKFSTTLVTNALVRRYGEPLGSLEPKTSGIMLPDGKFIKLDTEHHLAAREALSEFQGETSDPMKLLETQGFARIITGGQTGWNNEYVINLGRKPTPAAMKSLESLARSQSMLGNDISYELTDLPTGKSDSDIGVAWDVFEAAVRKFFK